LRIARIALWVGAVVDALAALQLLLPVTFTVGGFAGLRASGPGGQIAVGSAALLLGWSAIEIWAARRPVERQAVLFVGFAVLVVFLAQNAWLMVTARAEVATTLPILVLQIGIVVLFAAAIRAVRSGRRVVQQPSGSGRDGGEPWEHQE
jgi:hypothetical protein